MKICILTHCFPPTEGAAETYIWNLANELAKLKMEIVIITLRPPGPYPMVENYNNLKVYRFSLKFPFTIKGNLLFRNFGFMFQLRQKLEEVYEKEKFDILHSEHIFPVPSASRFSKNKKIPHVVAVEGISKESLYSKFVYLSYRTILPKSNFDVLVAWSRFLVEYIKKWEIDTSRIRIIPGGIDTKLFNPSHDGTALREKLMDHEGKLIFTAKPMYKTNALGLAYIIKAMRHVSREYPNCRLIIGGEGRKRKDLEKLTANLNLQKYIKFLGWIPQKDLPQYYAAADVIVNSIIYKHAGSVTLLESLASGKPNVLCDIDSLPGENSFPKRNIAMPVKPRDEKDMARGIITLLEDENLGRKLGENAWKFVKENFSIEKIALQYKNLYEGLV